MPKHVFMVNEDNTMVLVDAADISPEEAESYARICGPCISVGTAAEAVSSVVINTELLVALSTRLRYVEAFGGGESGAALDAARRRIAEMEAQSVALDLAAKSAHAQLAALRDFDERKLNVAAIVASAFPVGEDGVPSAISFPVDVSGQMDDAIITPFREAATTATQKLQQYRAIALLPKPGAEVASAIEDARHAFMLQSTACLDTAMSLLRRLSQSGDPVIVNTADLVTRSIRSAYGAIVEGMSKTISKEET